MRLIYLNAKQYPGGTADHYYVLNLAKAFYKKLGKNFTLVLCNTRGEHLSGIPIKDVTIPLFMKRTVFFFFWIPWYWVRELRKEKSPVIFFSNDLNLLAALIFWKKIFWLRYRIVSDWHLCTQTLKERFVAQGSDYCVTTSIKLERAVRNLGTNVHAQTFYGGVELEAYTKTTDKNILKNDLGLPQRKILVGYIGLFTTFGMDKGISMMIDALLYLEQDIVMVFVGARGKEIEYYQSYASSKNVLNRCLFVAVQPFNRVTQYEQAMDILVIPYPDKPHFRQSGFPMKVYEYMASGVPIIYTKLELVEEVLLDCAFGILPDEPKMLAEMVQYISKQTDEADARAQRATKKAQAYSWDAKAERFLEFFAIMTNMLTIPDSAVKYILFQRTEYLIYQNNKWINRIIIRIPFLTYNRMVAFEAWAFRARIKRLFSEDMSREYTSIKDFLPNQAEKILDIGCGAAGIDCMISAHYTVKRSTPDFYLLDKTELNPNVYYGLEEKASFYNSLSVAKSLLISNGVNPKRIYTQEATPDNKINFSVKFDLIVSLISWGFHYPVSVYLDLVYDVLKPGGVLIIDIRKGSGGEEALRTKFQNIQIIHEGKKHSRILVHKI